jgi:hypothetical protein
MHGQPLDGIDESRPRISNVVVVAICAAGCVPSFLGCYAIAIIGRAVARDLAGKGIASTLADARVVIGLRFYVDMVLLGIACFATAWCLGRNRPRALKWTIFMLLSTLAVLMFVSYVDTSL